MSVHAALASFSPHGPVLLKRSLAGRFFFALTPPVLETICVSPRSVLLGQGGKLPGSSVWHTRPTARVGRLGEPRLSRGLLRKPDEGT
jgi:hypothetical protein